MMRKYLIWITTILLLASFVLVSCSLPEVTPPAAGETAPVVSTPSEQTVPLPAQVITATPAQTRLIKASEVGRLEISQRVAVSNIQDISWSPDSNTLALVTQNTDAAQNQVFSVTLLNAKDLSTQAVYSATGNRVTSVAADGKTAAVINQDQMSFSLVDTSVKDGASRSRVTDFLIGNVTISPDMRYVAVTKAEFWEVILYDFNTLEEVRFLSGFSTAAPVFDAGFNHSPQWLVWHARATLQLQEVETGMLSNLYSHEDFVTAYTLSPDGMILASASFRSTNDASVPVVILWDTLNGTELKVLEISQPVNALQFSPDGKLLAVAAGSDLQIWDAAGGNLLTTLTGHSDFILQLAFSPDQHTIASAGQDKQLYLWQILE